MLTKSEAQAENFPFCTIDPNEARVVVNDSRFDWLVEHYKPLSRVPAYLNVTDIAGLVKGASEGQGLGAFLAYEDTFSTDLLSLIHFRKCIFVAR